jgi:hypothetical protein
MLKKSPIIEVIAPGGIPKMEQVQNGSIYFEKAQ